MSHSAWIPPQWVSWRRCSISVCRITVKGWKTNQNEPRPVSLALTGPWCLKCVYKGRGDGEEKAFAEPRPWDAVAGCQSCRGLISLENNLITNLYHSGNYHPQSCIKNVFLRQKMCCLWNPSRLRNFILWLIPLPAPSSSCKSSTFRSFQISQLMHSQALTLPSPTLK